MAVDMTELKVDTTDLLMDIKAVKLAFGGLDKVLGSISSTLQDVFSVKGYKDYKETVTRFG